MLGGEDGSGRCGREGWAGVVMVYTWGNEWLLAVVPALVLPVSCVLFFVVK